MKKHKLTNIDIDTMKGTCSICGPVRILKSYNKSNGYRCWKAKRKFEAERTKKRIPLLKKYDIKFEYNIYKKSACECCGFFPINTCQLDVHHKDGDHKNNNPENLQTLCANCHRLEHYFKGK